MQRNSKVQELSDGRIIAVMREPMPQDGWVVTHEDITKLRRIEAQMTHMSRHDALTDLPNLAELRDFDSEGARSPERGRAILVLLFDIDRFKEVNDAFGPSVASCCRP
jgi:GGDEF domain-containing protein